MHPPSIDDLMHLLYASQEFPAAKAGGAEDASALDHALRTAALLRRSHPSDKELQTAGLVHRIGAPLRPGEPAAHIAARGAETVRPLLGRRVTRLVLLQEPTTDTDFDQAPYAEDALTLRHAAAAATLDGLGVGVLEDWRPVLEIVAAAARVRV
ncbi:hypothetical protein DY218_30150 [Streptomyces triticagri]|uniref:HD domain-containing protein n=1 Tax=Streptomyces triticagri TaxID=2293568 RepID=A0A372LWS3_9ACTN|nr:hypothetical protein [Streptomyces triticagri]RFU82989.1 hypothetical protein DY218_30150 [Streptomyces triticagri]